MAQAQTNNLVDLDSAKRAALRRIKFIATLALIICIATFILARLFSDYSPIIGFIGAFAEAAAIGGLADWYAVVALFRHPLGLKFPHTAIIPSNQQRIADNLGRFIEVNFLAEQPVRKKLQEVDFAALVADWLIDRKRAEGLSLYMLQLLPKMLESLEGTAIKSFVTARIREQMERIPVAPLAADMLSGLMRDGRHQDLFEDIITRLGGFLVNEEAKERLRLRIRDELPSLANLFRADAYLLNKIIDSSATLIDDIKADPDHPMRREFDHFVEGVIGQLRENDAYGARIEQMKRDFLARPEFASLANGLWDEAKSFLLKDAQADYSMIRQYMTNFFIEAGRSLRYDPSIRADMNEGFVVALTGFVESQKSGVSSFISDQVKSWDLGQLTNLIELNIGRDLQYIRFNGMLIGGVAGLVLHSVDVLFLRG